MISLVNTDWCAACQKLTAGAEREPAEVRLRAEVARLSRSREDLASLTQRLQLFVQLVMEDNPTLNVKRACERAGVDYDTHILNRRI